MGLKTEERKEKQKATEREIVRIDMHLCDPCIAEFNSRLGIFVNKIRQEAVAPSTDDRPFDPGKIEAVTAIKGFGD